MSNSASPRRFSPAARGQRQRHRAGQRGDAFHRLRLRRRRRPGLVGVDHQRGFVAECGAQFGQRLGDRAYCYLRSSLGELVVLVPVADSRFEGTVRLAVDAGALHFFDARSARWARMQRRPGRAGPRSSVVGLIHLHATAPAATGG